MSKSTREEVARKTGRGFLIITIAKVWFLLTSAVIQLGLPIFLGSPEKFGIFKIITESIGWINMVMITGTLHAVSKLVSEHPDRAQALVNLAVKIQLLLGVPVALLYVLASPFIAARFNDPSLIPLLRLSAGILFFYAFYAIFVGYFNGLKHFVRQATLDVTFSTVKLVFIVGLVLLGFGVGGAVFGFVAAAGFVCIASVIWVLRRRRAGEGTDPLPRSEAAASMKRMAGYLLLIMAYTFALNGVMRIDFLLLRAIVSEVPASFVGLEDLFVLMANQFAGFYGAVLNIARIPYQGVIAVTFVIFPLVSEATFRDDQAQTRIYIRSTLRYCILLIGVVALLLAFNSDSIIAALYSEEYQQGAVALSILSVSIIFFALLYVASTIIIGSGHPLVAFAIMGVSLVTSAVANFFLLNWVHSDTMEMLEAGGLDDPAVVEASFGAQATIYAQWAAIATTLAMVVGFLLAVLWLWRTFEAAPPMATIGRVLLIAALLYGIDQVAVLPVELVDDLGKILYLGLVLGKMTLMGLVALAVLFLTREFTKTDFDRLRAVIGKRSSRGS